MTTSTDRSLTTDTCFSTRSADLECEPLQSRNPNLAATLGTEQYGRFGGSLICLQLLMAVLQQVLGLEPGLQAGPVV